MNNLECVLNYAAHGWQCFPLQVKAKEPLNRSRGFYDATTNPKRLERWFARYPYNVGIRTGVASGIFVLDVDGDIGFQSLRDLERENGRLPQTLTSLTSRGQHFWFRLDAPLPCSASKVGVGLDIKADGGYVAAPFSIHPSGKRYEWYDQNIAPAPAPEWLITCARAKKISERALETINRSSKHHGEPGAYGRVALEREIAILAAAAPGARNNLLNVTAFRLFQLVAGGELDEGLVENALGQACETNGLVQDDGWRSVRATIASSRRAGLQHPRSRWGSA